MRLSLFLVLFVVLTIAACVPPAEPAEPAAVDDTAAEQSVAEEAARNAIKALDEQWNAAMNAGDYEAIAGFFTEDAIRMQADVPAQVGREAILSAMRSDMEENTIESESVSVTEEIRLAGDWAVVRGTYEETATPKAGGEPVHTTGKWMEVHERQADGSWKISRSIGNRDAPLPASE